MECRRCCRPAGGTRWLNTLHSMSSTRGTASSLLSYNPAVVLLDAMCWAIISIWCLVIRIAGIIEASIVGSTGKDRARAGLCTRCFLLHIFLLSPPR